MLAHSHFPRVSMDDLRQSLFCIYGNLKWHALLLSFVFFKCQSSPTAARLLMEIPLSTPGDVGGLVCDVEPCTNELCLAASRAPEAALAPVWHHTVLLKPCQNILGWRVTQAKDLERPVTWQCGYDVMCGSIALGAYRTFSCI